MGAASLKEMQGYIVAAAPAEGAMKRRLEVAAHALGLDYSRVWNFYYGKARRVLSHEMDNARAKMALIRANEIERLRAKLSELEAADADYTRTLEGVVEPSFGTAAHALDPGQTVVAGSVTIQQESAG